MLDTVVEKLLPEAGQKTLETMFFATPDRVSMDPHRPAGELIAASLTFHGTPPGRFGLLISERLAKTLAENFTGCDDVAQLLPAQVAGVIGELANMLCGAVLTELESNAYFDLSSPETLYVGSGEPDPDLSTGSRYPCRFEFPEGTLVFFFAFEEPV